MNLDLFTMLGAVNKLNKNDLAFIKSFIESVKEEYLRAKTCQSVEVKIPIVRVDELFFILDKLGFTSLYYKEGKSINENFERK